MKMCISTALLQEKVNFTLARLPRNTWSAGSWSGSSLWKKLLNSPSFTLLDIDGRLNPLELDDECHVKHALIFFFVNGIRRSDIEKMPPTEQLEIIQSVTLERECSKI